MPDTVMLVRELIYGRWRSQILYSGVRLGLFDVIQDEPRSTSAIAQDRDLDPDLLYRLLRALGSLGLVKEWPDRWFSISEMGKILQSDHPQSLANLALLVEGPEHYAVWKHLPAIVQDGEQNGFIREYGHTGFEHTMLDPSYGAAFDAGMSSHSRRQAQWVLDALSTYDFSLVGRFCDVGGGQGHLLCQFLLQYPYLQGIVLERASVIENRQSLWAEKLGLGDRCQYVVGDMFVDVPTADAYILKMVLHDWNDEECVQILRAIYRGAASGGRVFIAEHIVPDCETPHFSKLFDIHMMVWGNGRERTLDEYIALLQTANWRYATCWAPSMGDLRVIECVKN